MCRTSLLTRLLERRSLALLTGLAACVAIGAFAQRSASAGQIPCATPTRLDGGFALQGSNYRGWFAIGCVPIDQTLSAATIAWGDGATSPGLVAYGAPDPSTGTKTAIIVGTHTFRRTNCKATTQRCTATYRVRVTATDTPSGTQRATQFELRTVGFRQ